MTETTTSRGGSDRPVALVTGASAGLGATFARALARRGYDMVLVARRRERLENLASELRDRFGVEAEPLPADLTKDEELHRVEDYLREKSVSCLVNNAGFGNMPMFHEDDVGSQEAMIRLHVLAVARLTHAALPGMMQRGEGNIINVSSVAAFIQGGSGILYCATKAWINSFTEGIHLLASDSGVRVQALCPGFTITEFHDVMGMDRGTVPRKWWMKAEDVVAASLKGLDRGKLFVVPGTRYKLMVLLIKLMPRSLRHVLTRRHERRELKETATAEGEN